MAAKSLVRLISVVLFVSVFAVWGVFYYIISGYITDSTEKQTGLAAAQIIERLGGEFSGAERLSYNLKHSAAVQALLRERNVRDFFTLAGAAAKSFAAEINVDFIDSVILYGPDETSYQLSGALGNNACSRLYGIVSSLELPHHLTAVLDGKPYIGYADEIPLGGTDAGGAVAVLIEEEKILEILRAYDQSGALLVVIRASGETVAANTGRADEIDSLAKSVTRSNLGVTPYEILVAADRAYMDGSLVSFSIVALITAAIFAAVLLAYTGLLNRRFFRPLVSVIGGIKQLQTGGESEMLPHVQSAEFDAMIDKFNEMLAHIEAKNAEVLAAEVGRQKALVVSMQKQINAHFIVNTMGAIRGAIRRGEHDKAETLISGLTRIFRYAHSKEETVNIWDEAEILQYYANIMSVRYGGKLRAEFDFDEDLMESDMPRMLLQPLMENAVEHGFKDMDAGCVISVKAELRGGVIRFTVGDNGCGLSDQALSALRERLRAAPGGPEGLESIALPNIRNRLRYYYGGAARLDVSPSDGGGVQVTIEIPASVQTGGAL